MRQVRELLHRWNAQSLANQFLLAGAAVSIVAMFLVGAFVTSLIEATFTRNAAATTALYVDSIIAPILPDMRTTDQLAEPVSRALDETLGQGALGGRLLSFRLWRRDGTILYSDQKDLVGRRFTPGENLQAAFAGRIVAEYDELDEAESAAEAESGHPLLEIYYPVLQPWSGEVVAVAEFYEIASDFQRNLSSARMRSWAAVALVTLCFFLLLSAIVLRGSRTIERQSVALTQRVAELSDLLARNEMLSARLQRASQRATALNEQYLRRLGADLHDGPAQLVALAALRLDSRVLSDPAAPVDAREGELSAISNSLDDAMREIRSICNGLILPQVETSALPDILRLAVKAHEQRTNVKVELDMDGSSPPLSPSARICVYRFVQEGLNNGYRHAGGRGQSVTQRMEGGRLSVEVADRGPGMAAAAPRSESLGLAGLRERVESLGGSFSITTSPSGVRLKIFIDAHEMEHA